MNLIIEYDGTDFAGYELQPGKRTVRGEIEKALHKIYKKKISIRAVSRTDSGVHALCNNIFFTPPFKIPELGLVKGLNALLPEDIRVCGVGDKVRGVKSKTYEYLIYNGEVMPVHLRRIAWQVIPKLNLPAMRRAAKQLVGKHDFSSFCAAGGDDKDFVCTINRITIRKRDIGHWTLDNNEVINIVVNGNRFLYKMVRNLVGYLVEIGLGRKRKKLTAPAKGLCLILQK